jgi:Mn-containing catalase
MFRHTKQLAYKVRVDRPDPTFARALQQALGGVEGEVRVMLQYLMQGFNFRGPARYKDMLLNTGTEEIGHIEMLATAIALNLEGASEEEQMNGARNPLVGAVMDGGDPRHLLSAGMGAMVSDSNGVPFNGSWVIGTGNLAADMHANIAAEGGGRVLATRLWEMTDDPGMKEMLAYLIARDTMHQNQWMAVLEEFEDMGMPVPHDFPQSAENEDFNYTFLVHSDGEVPDDARWTSGPSVDSHGKFDVQEAQALGEVPELAPPESEPRMHNAIKQASGGFMRKAKDAITP